MKTTRSIRMMCSLAFCALLGAAVAGSVFFASPAYAANLTALASFDSVNGRQPHSGLIADADGNLYGTASRGGTSDYGTIFKLDRATGVLTALASFDGVNGRQPHSGLIADADGNLYGTTEYGGASNYGTVFKLALDTGALTTLASFDGANGRAPYAGLMADADGNLYGTASGGGASNYGTVFKLALDSGSLTTLASFDGANGRAPYAGLIADADGNLYGTTSGGGARNSGTVFKLDSDTGAITTLISFNSVRGGAPTAGLIVDAIGNLYGTTSGGGRGYGTVFKLEPATGALSTLASFDGSRPTAGLIADADGNLYGTTYQYGPSFYGTVFKLDPATSAITTLASFSGANGGYPYAGLITDADGNLYGTTEHGGSSRYGTVFKLTDTGFVVPVVPEPASLLLLALGAAAMLRRRRA